MALNWNLLQYAVRIHLDTGYSVPLISSSLTERLNLPKVQWEKAAPLRKCSGEEVKGARLEYTRPLRLQHRRYFTQKVFEVTPLEPEVDDFLPFWWISQHPPRGVWESDEIRFNSPWYIQEYTQWETNGFSLTLDEEVTQNAEARIVGYVSAIHESGEKNEPT